MAEIIELATNAPIFFRPFLVAHKEVPLQIEVIREIFWLGRTEMLSVDSTTFNSGSLGLHIDEEHSYMC